MRGSHLPFATELFQALRHVDRALEVNKLMKVPAHIDSRTRKHRAKHTKEIHDAIALLLADMVD